MPSAWIKCVATAALAAGLWSAIGVWSAARATDTPPAPLGLDEVVVTGEHTGPGLWHVYRGGAHVWIVGSMSPLPKGITWRATQVESLLDGAQRVLVQKPFEIGFARILWLLVTQRSSLMVTGGRRLIDVMPPDLHARFAAQRAKYTDDAQKWERYRPLIAAAFLQQAAFHKVGLSTRLDLGAAVRKLADAHHVRIEELKIAGVSDMLAALKTMPAATETACVEASLVTVESGLPRLVDRAQAWAAGNLELMEKLREPPEVDACRAALDAGTGANELITLVRRTWLDRIEKYLQNDTNAGVTLAVINTDLLLERGGLLDELRAKNYAIDAP